jgi:hypothetical protein
MGSFLLIKTLLKLLMGVVKTPHTVALLQVVPSYAGIDPRVA